MRNVLSLRHAMLSLALAIPALSNAAGAQRPSCEERAAPAPAGGWAPPLDTRVSVSLRDVSLREALDRLTAASGVQLAYSVDFLPVDRRVCLTADREPIGGLLTTLVRGAPIQVLVIAGRIVLSPGATAVSATPTEAMARSVSVLERVVVTGSAVAAPRRPLVIGVEVLDGEQLRRQSLGSLAELLNASVPGVWSWAQSPSALVSQYGGIRGTSSFGSSSPKIYIDGVEVANPLVVTQLNPDAVDHIEVIRGPQGSALYGSDAISGVVNVLTRHDAGGFASPALQLRSMAGAAGSQFVSGLVPTHEQRLNLRLGSNVKSAGLAVSFGQTGALFPSSESRTLAATGDARLVTSRETLTMTLRLFDKQAGMGRNPLIGSLLPISPLDTGRDDRDGGTTGPALAPSNELTQSVRQYTLSTSGTFATDGPWTHTILGGVDGYSLDHVEDSSGPFTTAVDSALRAARGNGDRVTLRESSVARFGTSGVAEGTVTLGVEYSVLRQATAAVIGQQPPTGGQRYPTAIEGLRETWNHNTGFISQLGMSWRESIFLTGGLRLERNDAFSGSNRYPLLPMVGLAVVRSAGDAEIKWRAAYGKGIRPPQTPARGAAMGYAGNLGYNGGVANVLPALDPEEQAGYEGGVELYLGRALSFQLTRFDQHVTGLIQNVAVAVDTFSRGSTIERRIRYQLQNVGEITNTGWEVQGNASLGLFNLATTFSSVDSRVRALANGYMGDLQPGDRMLAVPRRTGSATLSWVGERWFASLGATRAMDWINYDRLAITQAYVGMAGDHRMLTGSALRTFWRTYDGETHLRLNVSRDIKHGVALLVTGENLLGGQLGEPDNVTIRPGRSVTAGLRASF